MNIKVTTTKPSQNDICRSGATSIPDALRMPNVQVERVATDRWAINVLTFNGIYTNKLQVLMDGRSVHAPLFSRVLLEQQDTTKFSIQRQ